MINTNAELIRIVEYLEDNMPVQTWQGVLLDGGIKFIAYSVN